MKISLTVVHSLPVWLPATATWLWNHVRHLPPSIRSEIVCSSTENLDQFPAAPLRVLSNQAAWLRLSERILRRSGAVHRFGFLARKASAARAEIIHSHWGDVGWRDSPTARAVGTKHLVSFYGKDVSYLPRVDSRWRERYRRMFADVDAVMCEGPHMGRCITALGCPAEKVRVVHLGVDVSRIPFKPRAWRPPQELRILIAASFREKKGIPDAIAAVGRLRSTYVNVSVTVIGDASDDPRSQPEKQRILAAIEEHGLRERTRLLGYQPYSVLLEQASTHHVFLSPSVTAADGDTEGGAPVTVIEMAASGMAIVSTRHCDIPSVVIDGHTGFLADEHDVPALARHLVRLVDSAGEWQPMLLAARQHIESEYDVVRQGIRWAEVYRSLG